MDGRTDTNAMTIICDASNINPISSKKNPIGSYYPRSCDSNKNVMISSTIGKILNPIK